MKKAVSLILALITLLFCLTACGIDKYKDYHATNMQTKIFLTEYDNLIFETDTVELITDYEDYSAYQFNLDYTEGFFKNNDLLVFIVQSCSSDQMEFVEMREKDGVLYPLFERKKIGENDPITDDIIISSYCVEISKELEYKAGEIIYNYK
ncbi:MAG: hypothetical protein E7371_01565 [Clostridiales bacterium]|nr:hypothetical protein [Clostridiales bacterium]